MNRYALTLAVLAVAGPVVGVAFARAAAHGDRLEAAERRLYQIKHGAALTDAEADRLLAAISPDGGTPDDR